MNKSTIGFKGGCNPVPFEYEIKDKKIYIDKATLEKEKDRFPVGDQYVLENGKRNII